VEKFVERKIIVITLNPKDNQHFKPSESYFANLKLCPAYLAPFLHLTHKIHKLSRKIPINQTFIYFPKLITGLVTLSDTRNYFLKLAY
jgi:hypothetical protein